MLSPTLHATELELAQARAQAESTAAQLPILESDFTEAVNRISVLLGEWYFMSGTLFNSLILVVVTVMTEQKMLKNWPPARAKLYRERADHARHQWPIPTLPKLSRVTE